MLIFIPILIFVALVIVGGGKNRPAGLPVDGRALWPLYPNAAAGIKPGGALYGSHRPQN
jgi:hypothetical protein